MNFLLKIVEGPNKGAEIALVPGVAVTLGKGDDCDIVLADPTLPTEAVTFEASDDGVTAGGEPLEPFVVKTIGATSFAIGPADAPWGGLKWEAAGEAPRVGAGKPDAEEGEPVGNPVTTDEAAPPPAKPPREGRRRGFGCLLAALALLLALLFLGWFFRAPIARFARRHVLPSSRPPAGRQAEPDPTLADIAGRYGLTLEDGAGGAKLSGNFTTRRERLAATAEAYAARPGVDLDLSDDESFRVAAEDALFTLTEGALKVVSATNRVLSIRGVAHSPEALKRTLLALDADLSKMRDVDVAGVRFEELGIADEPGDPSDPRTARPRNLRLSKSPTSFPVCGILTKPYPCLVMRDGSRVLEGAPLGDSVVLKIEADSVTLTNAMGTVSWKP